MKGRDQEGYPSLLSCPVISFLGPSLFRLGHPPCLIPQSHWSSCSRFSRTAYPCHVLLSLSVLAASVPQFSCRPPHPSCAPFAVQLWNPHHFIVMSCCCYIGVILQTAPANPVSHDLRAWGGVPSIPGWVGSMVNLHCQLRLEALPWELGENKLGGAGCLRLLGCQGLLFWGP